MYIFPRVIPALLMQDQKLVKTKNFQDAKYVGDPVNVISIFNDFEVDEIILLDISQARQPAEIDFEFLERLASECFVPLAYAGGVRSVADASRLIKSGFEKVVFNTAVYDLPEVISGSVAALGSQAVVASLDVRGNISSGYKLYSDAGSVEQNISLEQWCVLVTKLNVGEVFVTNIDREGTREGYDLDLVSYVSSRVNVPVIAHGGAGTRADLRRPISDAGAAAVAAGSQFVMQRGRDSVLINYPLRSEIEQLFQDFATGLDDEEFSGVITEKAAPIPGRDLSNTIMCSRCIITSDVPNAQLKVEGDECFYCGLHDKLDTQYQLGPAADAALESFVQKLKKAGQGKKYDCIMGVSGGTDSSYLAHLLVSKGVRPLAVHFDNTWNSPIATANIYAVLDKLGVDLETYVVDNSEYDDIYRAFMLSGVKDIEAPTDIGFMGVLYRAAEKHGIKHIVEGHSFRTEGVSPMGWLYMDGGYVKSVHKKLGRLPMKTYPNMDFWHFIKWSLFSGIERTRPLYWLDYVKEEAKQFLAKEYGWTWYGGHHLENRFTAFYHSYFLPKRFRINFRQIELSALVRSGQMQRDDAIEQFVAPRQPDSEQIAMVKKRLEFSDAEFERVMTMPVHTYREFDTYKKRFELLRPVFWVLMKLRRVPESFYIKFCKR